MKNAIMQPPVCHCAMAREAIADDVADILNDHIGHGACEPAIVHGVVWTLMAFVHKTKSHVILQQAMERYADAEAADTDPQDVIDAFTRLKDGASVQ
jgi:hypothetical protein